MVTPSLLHEHLARLGIGLGDRVPWDCPDELEGSWIAAGQELARRFEEWTQPAGGPPQTARTAARHLCEQLAARDQLTGWDAWIATCFRDGSEPDAAGEPPPLPLGQFDPDALSHGELLAATLTLAAERDLSGCLLGLAWLSERGPLAPDQAADLCALVIGKALATPEEPSPAPIAPEDWRQELTAAAELTALLRGLTDPGTDRKAPSSADLTGLARALPPPAEAGAPPARRARGLMFRLADANRRIASGDANLGYEEIRRLTAPPAFPTPAGANANAWHQILINAASNSGPPNPTLTLIESKSLPRTGHHHLMRVLRAAHKEDFSYCEQYQEPGCCEATPCNAEPYWNHARQHGRNHVRLVKSHDFDLADLPYPTPRGVIRLVQVRQPLPTLASWMEFEHLRWNKKMLQAHGICPSRIYLLHEPALIETSWQLIDRCGESMGAAEAQAWLEKQTRYIIDFLAKWLPLCEELPADVIPCQGTYLLRYEDLGLQGPILTALGAAEAGGSGEGNGRARESYRPRQGNVLQRPSSRISRLLADSARPLADCEARILEATQPWARLLRYGPTSDASLGLG